MAVAVKGGQCDVFGLAAGMDVGIEHLAAELRREELVVRGIEPEARDPCRRTVAAGSLDQPLRSQVAATGPGLRLPAAAPAGEVDDGKYARRIFARRGD